MSGFKVNTKQNHRSEESLEERPRLFLSGVLGKSDHCIPEFGLHHLFNYQQRPNGLSSHCKARALIKQ